VEERIKNNTEVGGIARYEGDYYFRVKDGYPGNPWFICSLWLAQYYIATAKKSVDLQEPMKWLQWTVKYALPSGVLPEQLNPFTGEALSATPLTWSHSEFIVTVMEYLEKEHELGLCETHK
jgi:GH15 family glucan-1,4-alpha-glucosidase